MPLLTSAYSVLRRHAIPSAVLAITLIGAVGFGAWCGFGGAHSETQVQASTDALPPLDPRDGKVAAYVNGAPISQWQVDFLRAAQAQGMTSTSDSKTVLDSLIDQELLYQAAVKANLIPTDAEVQATMDQLRKTLSPTDQESLLSLEKKYFGVASADDYWNDPRIAQEYKRTMAIRAYTVSLGGQTSDEKAAAQKQALESLRKNAKIVIVQADPAK